MFLLFRKRKEEQERRERKEDEKIRRKVMQETAQGIKDRQPDTKIEVRQSFRKKILKTQHENGIKNKENGINNNGYIHNESSHSLNHIISTSNEFRQSNDITDGNYNATSGNSFIKKHSDIQDNMGSIVSLKQDTIGSSVSIKKDSHRVDIHDSNKSSDDTSSCGSTIITVKNEKEIAETKFDQNELQEKRDSFTNGTIYEPDEPEHRNDWNSAESASASPSIDVTAQGSAVSTMDHDELMRRSKVFLEEDLENVERYNRLPPLNPLTSFNN